NTACDPGSVMSSAVISFSPPLNFTSSFQISGKNRKGPIADDPFRSGSAGRLRECLPLLQYQTGERSERRRRSRDLRYKPELLGQVRRPFETFSERIDDCIESLAHGLAGHECQV